MKSVITASLCVIIALSSCSPFKQASVELRTDKEDGLQIIRHENVKITLYGDYLLHEYSEKKTMNWDEAFMQSIKSDGNSKPEILFSSHTFAQPHCTLLSTVYHDSSQVSSNVETYLKSLDPYVKHEEKEIGKQDYIILSYDLKDEDLEIYLFHIDYFLSVNGRTYRFSFWSSDRDRKWLFRESTAVLTLLKVGTE